MIDYVRYLIGVYGEVVGLITIGIVLFRAFTRVGWELISTMRIGPLGIIIMMIGLLLIVVSKHLDKNF